MESVNVVQTPVAVSERGEGPSPWLAYLTRIGERSIRPMRPADIHRVVDLHRVAFPDYFLTSLGRRVLQIYYESIVESETGFALVFERGGRMLGFITGLLRPGGFYRALLKRRGLRFAFACGRAVIQRPAITGRIASAVLQRCSLPREGNAAELTSLAVVRDAEGLGCGLALILAAMREVERRGGEEILGGVRKDNQGLLEAYLRLGWKPAGEVGKQAEETVVLIRYNFVRQRETEERTG